MRRVLAGTGKLLITVGLLVLIFVVYQLWGTGIYTARAQDRLQRDFETTLDATSDATPSPTGDPPAAVTTIDPPPSVPAGDAVAHLEIPKIGVDAYVVEGVGEDDLRKGPGRYPLTPLPGQMGNAGIAGHRTTYGAPFGPLDELEDGDAIRVTTVQGSFEYRVYKSFVVAPDAYEVLETDPTRPATLTLTTCHPRYSAAQRLVVKAELQITPGTAPLPAAVTPTAPTAADIAGEGLSGGTGPTGPTLAFGALTLAIGALWWLVFHRHPRWTTWVLGAVPFLVALAYFYYSLERMLPSNY